VLGHAMLLAVTIAVLGCFPGVTALRLLDASVIVAQFSLLTIWITLDGKPSLLRAVQVSFVMTLIYAAHAATAWDLEMLLGLVCVVPAAFILVTVYSLPLSIAQWMGLELMRFGPKALPPPRRLQFSIRGLLWVTVGIALLFGLKELSLARGPQPGSPSFGMVEILATFMMMLVGITVYLSAPLVCVWVAVPPGKILPRLTTAVVGWGLGGVLVAHYTSMGSWGPAIPAAAIAGGVPIVLATLFVLRRLGYRVVWVEPDGWFPMDEPAPSSPFPSTDGKNSCHHAPP